MTDALTRLFAARELIDEARHAEALAEFVWFHDHALEENASLYGVRRSYALQFWTELAEQYAPARTALDGLRERAAARLLAGDGDRDTFLDVLSIDHALDQPQQARDLFVALEKVAPELAASSTRVVLPLVIAAGDFALAERLMPDPAGTIRQHADYLMDVFRARRQRFSGAPSIPAEVYNYVLDVNAVLDVLAARGRHPEVRALRAFAADVIPATTLRREVRTALLPGAPAWYERGVPRR